MIKRILKVFILSTAFISCLTGCSLSRESTVATETDAEEATEITDINDLQSEHFYIYDNVKQIYHPVYMKNASFKSDPEHLNTTQDNSRSIYFTDDWEDIPTYYEGNSLVYYTKNDLNENFVLERFKDEGYSIGISNLQPLASGRYFFNAHQEEDELNPYINPDSEANQLFELDHEQVIIDNIGGATLRKGNVTDGGVIVPLKKNSTYAVDVYVGSTHHNYQLKADTRILTSMEVYQTTDYELNKSRILTINIPDEFNNGYYMINGQGVFRYVKGTSYTERTDFNIPNDIPEEETTETNEASNEATTEAAVQQNINSSYIKEEKFTIKKECDCTIRCTITNNDNSDNSDDLSIKVLGYKKSYTLNKIDNTTYELTTHLESDTYTLQFIGLGNRSYRYRIEEIKEQ